MGIAEKKKIPVKFTAEEEERFLELKNKLETATTKVEINTYEQYMINLIRVAQRRNQKVEA